MSGVPGFCYDCNTAVPLRSEQDGEDTVYKCRVCSSEFVEVRTREPSPQTSPQPPPANDPAASISEAVGNMFGGIMRGVRQVSDIDDEDEEEVAQFESVINPLASMFGNFVGSIAQLGINGFTASRSRRRRTTRHTARSQASAATTVFVEDVTDDDTAHAGADGVSATSSPSAVDAHATPASSGSTDANTFPQRSTETSVPPTSTPPPRRPTVPAAFRASHRVHLPAHARAPPMPSTDALAAATDALRSDRASRDDTSPRAVTSDDQSDGGSRGWADADVSVDMEIDVDVGDGGQDGNAPRHRSSSASDGTAAARVGTGTGASVYGSHGVSADVGAPTHARSSRSTSAGTQARAGAGAGASGQVPLMPNIPGMLGNVIPGIMNMITGIIPDIMNQELNLGGLGGGEPGLSENDISELEEVEIPEGVLELCERDNLHTLPRGTAWLRYVAEAARRGASKDGAQEAALTASSSEGGVISAEAVADTEMSDGERNKTVSAASSSSLATVEDEDEEDAAVEVQAVEVDEVLVAATATQDGTPSAAVDMLRATAVRRMRSQAAAADGSDAEVVEQATEEVVAVQAGDDVLAVSSSSTSGSASVPVQVEEPEAKVPLCAVCLCPYQALDRIVRLHCGHDYHAPCAKEWLRRHNSCPVCRARAREPSRRAPNAAGNARGNVFRVNLGGNLGAGAQITGGTAFNILRGAQQGQGARAEPGSGPAAPFVHFVDALSGAFRPQDDVRMRHAPAAPPHSAPTPSSTPAAMGAGVATTSSLPSSSSSPAPAPATGTPGRPAGMQVRLHLHPQPHVQPHSPQQAQTQTSPQTAAHSSSAGPTSSPTATSPASPSSAGAVPDAAASSSAPVQQQTIRIHFGPQSIPATQSTASASLAGGAEPGPVPTYAHAIGPAPAPTAVNTAASPGSSPTGGAASSQGTPLAGHTVHISHGPNGQSQTIQIIHSGSPQSHHGSEDTGAAGSGPMPTIRIQTATSGVPPLGPGSVHIAPGVGQTIRINFGPGGVVTSTETTRTENSTSPPNNGASGTGTQPPPQ